MNQDEKKFEQFEQVVQKIDLRYKLLRAWELKGGFSAQVTALEVERPDGQLQKMVLRQHNAWHRERNPQVAAFEFKLLETLHPLGLASPQPYLYDDSSEILSTPYVVLEFIEGLTEFAPANLPDLLYQLARQLCKIHQVDGSAQELSFLPEQAKLYAKKFSERPAKLDDSLNEVRIRETLEAVWPLQQHNKSVLLHGDYWPGNVLWQDGQLVGVIDWENAELGDPLADLGNTRMELLWTFGIEAMHQFTQFYKETATTLDFGNLPYWDLCAALRPMLQIAAWAADPVVEKIWRERHQVFVAQALEAVTV